MNVYGQINSTSEYHAKGMTLISITAPDAGPVAHREVEQIVPDGQVPFGGFATVIGDSHDPGEIISRGSVNHPPKVFYMFGVTNNGLQLARALVQDVTNFTKWTFFDRQQKKFVDAAPALNKTTTTSTYLDGSFSSGNIFYSTYSSMSPTHPTTVYCLGVLRLCLSEYHHFPNCVHVRLHVNVS